MFFFMSLILGVSIAINIIFVWYTRKLVQNLYYGVNNVDELQKLLNEYVILLEPIVTMENYYGDQVIASAITNTKMVIDACKVYKSSILESYNEDTEKTEEENTEKSNQSQAEISKA